MQDLPVPVTTVSTRDVLRSVAGGDLVLPRRPSVDDISATVRSVSPVRPASWKSSLRHPNCIDTVYVQQPSQDAFVFAVELRLVMLSYRCIINLIRATLLLFGALVVTLWTCYGAL